MCGYFTIRFLNGLRPASHVVPQFVGSEIVRVKPSARFETDDAQTGPRERKCGYTPDGAETDNDDVSLRQVRGHRDIPGSRLALAGLFFENIA